MSDGEQKSRRTGRPRGFDERAAVEAARDLFWRRGLAGTSYDDLTVATGLHRPSVHAAFGDKRGLFAAALSRYLEDSAATLTDALARPALADALAAFFEADLELFAPKEGGRGCYALGVTAEAGREFPALAEAEKRAWRGLSAALAARVADAAEGEIPDGLTRELVVDLVIATHVTLAARARAGDAVDLLKERASRLLKMFGTVAKGPRGVERERPSRSGRRSGRGSA